MKMAKASEADLEMAMELCGSLYGLTSWHAYVPAGVERVADSEECEPFDGDDREQCVRVLGYLLSVAGRGSLMRVVWGCAVMLDPRNRYVDPDTDAIEHHPDAKAWMGGRKARPSSEWQEGLGPVLWWKFPVDEPPYCGTPLDAHWPARHAHWTPLIVPENATKYEATDFARGAVSS
jgi:hypothetical protein